LSSRTRRLLLVRLSHLGDVLHALPVYHALRLARPEASLAWAVQPEFAGLLRGLPGLVRTLPFRRRGGARAWLDLRRHLRSFAADWAVDAQGNAKSAAVTWLSGAPRRSGWHPSLWTEPLAARVLNDRTAPLEVDGPLHAVRRALHLARHLAPEVMPEDLPAALLALNDHELAGAERRYEELLGQAVAPVLLQLSAPGDVRSWPVEHQLELLRRLDREGRDVLVLSGPGEAALGRRVAEELAGAPRLRHWVGQRALRELAALFRVAGARGARLVSVDTGPLHLAAACELPVLGLAGPQDARRTGPWPLPGADSPHRVLRAPEPLYCAPCLRRHCERPQGVACMEGIRPEAVIRALRD